MSGIGGGPQYERPRPPQNRGFDLHVREDGPEKPLLVSTLVSDPDDS